jgi:hypothetical protein
MKSKYKHKKQRREGAQNPRVAIPTGVNQEMTTEPKSSTEGQDDKKKPMGFIYLIKSDPKFRVEFVAVIVGLAVLIVYGLQLRVMQKSFDESRKNFRLDERAWITVSYGKIDLKENEPIYAPTTITNTGKTVAKNIEGFVFVSAVKHDATPDFGPTYTPGVGYMRTAVHIGMLAPNSPSAVPVIAVKREVGGAAPIILTTTLRQEIDSGQSVIMAYGQITYTDIFSTKHWLHFCGIHGSIMTSVGAKCTAYNDTDND